uniref:Type III potassium channel toxin protein n=1 Tax=Anemonia sulcata TaxID=6108 RepID=A0A0S1M189_ANESU|nr:type III potassium channel toxin protein [Anemonia sulcata]
MKCIIILLLILTLTSGRPRNELENTKVLEDHKPLTKRVTCHCKGKSGTYWFGISECHDPSSIQCYAFMGVCCVPTPSH